MNKIFYWSPYLSNVATIRNVINSALSLKKYNYNSYDVSLLDTIGEWKLYKEEIIQNKVNIKKINNLNLNFDLNKSGYFKSRLYFIFIFIFNFFPLLKLLKIKKPNFLIVHLLTSLPLTLLLLFQFKTKFILRISGLPRLNFIRKMLWRLIGKKIFLVTCPSKETLNYINELNIFDSKKVTLLNDPIIDVSKIHNNLKKKITWNFFDLLDLNSVSSVAANILSNVSKIDFLINCAMSSYRGKNFSYNEKNFLEEFNGIYGSTFLITEKLLPAIRKSKNGKIINVGSIWGSNSPKFESYLDMDIAPTANISSGKAALMQYTKFLVLSLIHI